MAADNKENRPKIAVTIRANLSIVLVGALTVIVTVLVIFSVRIALSSSRQPAAVKGNRDQAGERLLLPEGVGLIGSSLKGGEQIIEQMVVELDPIQYTAQDGTARLVTVVEGKLNVTIEFIDLQDKAVNKIEIVKGGCNSLGEKVFDLQVPKSSLSSSILEIDLIDLLAKPHSIVVNRNNKGSFLLCGEIGKS